METFAHPNNGTASSRRALWQPKGSILCPHPHQWLCLIPWTAAWGFEGQHQHFQPGLRLFCLPQVQVMAPRGSWKCGRCVGVALAAVTTCPWLCKELYAIPHVLQFKSAIWWRKHRRNDVEINCLRRSVAVSCQRKCFTGAAVFPSCFQPLLFGWQLAEISLSQSVHLS